MAVWTSPDWNLPTESSLYTDVLDYIDFRLDDVATGFSGTLSKSFINLPSGTIRFNTNKWEKWDGASWSNLASIYSINISGTSTNITGVATAANGGTGLNTYTIGDILLANSATSFAKLSAVAVGRVLVSKGAATLPAWESLDLETYTTGILPVSKGGTGVNTITGLLYGNGTSDVSSASPYISIDTSTSLVNFAGDIRISGNDIQSSSGASAITLSGSNVTINGSLNSGSIASSGTISCTSTGTIGGNLKVSGNNIISSTNNVAITLSDTSVQIANILYSAGITSSGDISSGGTITSTSDRRLKTNIKIIDNALYKLDFIRGVYFDMNNTHQVGVIAQEVEEVLPEVVNNSGQYKSVAYGNLVALLIEAIKELNKKVERLENAG